MNGMNSEMGSRHDELLQLLPWYANGSLKAAERRVVAQHLKSCAHCRDELVEIELVQTRWQRESAVFDAGEGFARLLARIERVEATTDAVGAPVEPLPASAERERKAEAGGIGVRRRLGKWLSGLSGPSKTFLPLAAMASALLFSVIGARSWLASAPAGYRTLGLPVSDGAVGNRDLRIVFAPSATIQQVVKLVESLDATIIDGPTEPGAFTLRMNGPDSAESAAPRVAELLRGDPTVLYVAPALAPIPHH